MTKELPPPEDDRDRAIFGDIARVGWSVLQIDPDPGETGPPFSFSLGLYHTHDHAEVILIGLKHPVAGTIVNGIGAAIVAGTRIEPGRIYDDFASVPLAFVAVDVAHSRDYVGYANWLYRGPTFPLLLRVWPLKSGLFPWEASYDPAGAAIQPLLGRWTGK